MEQRNEVKAATHAQHALLLTAHALLLLVTAYKIVALVQQQECKPAVLSGDLSTPRYCVHLLTDSHPDSTGSVPKCYPLYLLCWNHLHQLLFLRLDRARTISREGRQ